LELLKPFVSLSSILAALLCSTWVCAQTPDTASSPRTLKKLSLEELMALEVTVTSVSRRPEKLSETASAIQVITQDDIRRSGATSLPEALRLASNLEVAQIDSHQWAISARGFNSTTSNKLLVLIDGRTVYTPLYAGVFWDVQDTLLEDIDRIEVISGPGATLWGANAVNGVINITTKKAQDTQGPLLTATGGRELRDSGAVRYGAALGTGFHYRAYAKYFERDSTALANGSDALNGWHMAQGGFRLDGALSARDGLTVQADLYSGRIEQTASDPTTVSGGNLLGRWSRTVSERSDLKLQLYVDRTRRRIPGTFAEALNTYDVDFQHHVLLGTRHDVVWGLGYRLIDDDVSNSLVLAFLPPKVTRQWFSAFLQDEVALVADQLNLTFGTKVEHNDYTGLEFQPSVRLAWRVSERDTLWSAVSRAVRTPSRIDREFYAPSVPPFFLVGGTDFRSEKLIAYEAGYRTRLRPRLSVSLAAYYNDYDDLRSVEQVNPPAAFPIFIGNGLKGDSYGAELSADYRVMEAWRLRAGYTELRLHLTHKPGSTDMSAGSGEAQDARRQASFRSSLDLPANWQLEATYRYVSRIDSRNVPGYSEADLRLAWQPRPALELSLVGQNLLHDRHAEFGPLLTRQEIERGVYVKVLWGF